MGLFTEPGVGDGGGLGEDVLAVPAAAIYYDDCICYCYYCFFICIVVLDACYLEAGTAIVVDSTEAGSKADKLL